MFYICRIKGGLDYAKRQAIARCGAGGHADHLVSGTQVTAAEVQQHADKEWKMTSVLTFLSRLCDKGFLSCTKEGRQNLYTPLVSEEDYRQSESVGFLRRLCGGSVKNLVASLSDAGALTEQDIDELRAFLDRQTH